MGRSLCTSVRNLDKHWDLSFDVVATRAMLAGQRGSNRLGMQIVRTDLPRGVGHHLLGGQNPVLDRPADRMTGDAEQFFGFEHRQPFTILLRRPIGVNVMHAPYGTDTVCGPRLAPAGPVRMPMRFNDEAMS